MANSKIIKILGVVTIVYFGKSWKTIKIRQVYKKWILSSRVDYAVGKVLASYNACPKAVPLTRYTKMMQFSRCLIFPETK